MGYYRHIRSILSTSDLWWDSVKMIWYAVINKLLITPVYVCYWQTDIVVTAIVWWSSGHCLCLIAYNIIQILILVRAFVLYETLILFIDVKFLINAIAYLKKKLLSMTHLYMVWYIFNTIDKLLLLPKRCNVNGSQSRGIKYEGDSAP